MQRYRNYFSAVPGPRLGYLLRAEGLALPTMPHLTIRFLIAPAIACKSMKPRVMRAGLVAVENGRKFAAELSDESRGSGALEESPT